MTTKLFPWTYTGDQLRLEFQYAEEAAAFASVVDQLKARIETNELRETPIQDFVFRTSLEHDVASDNVSDLKDVLGLEVLNIFKKDSSYIKPSPQR